MAVTLRLTRMGRKKRPYYRIVAADSRGPRDGKYLEKIGTYNPLPDPPEIEIDKELALKWLQNGAKPSVTVRNFLSDQGIMFEYDLRKRGLSDEEIEMEYKKWEVVQQERKKKEEALLAMKKREDEKSTEEEARAKAKEEEKAKAEEAEAEATAAAAEEGTGEQAAAAEAQSEAVAEAEAQPEEQAATKAPSEEKPEAEAKAKESEEEKPAE